MSEELIQRAKQGDLVARDQVVESLKGRITYHAMKYPKFLREDLLQEGVIGVLEAISHYTPQGLKFANYASYWIIARMLDCLKMHRLIWIPDEKQNSVHHKFLELDVFDRGVEGPEYEYPAPLQVLSQREAQIIKLRFWDDLTLRQVSAILGVKFQRVFQIEKSALSKLRNAMGVKTSHLPKKKKFALDSRERKRDNASGAE